jgi:hypothetical protein
LLFCEGAKKTDDLSRLPPPDYLYQCLFRHSRGDWGMVCKEDAASNGEALEKGFRLFSAYPLDPARPCKGFGENTLWIITEADRSATTFFCRASIDDREI